MPTALDTALETFSRRMEAVHSDVVRADALSLGKDAALRDLFARVRASSYVIVAAALEDYVRSAIQGALQELVDLQLKLGDLGLGLAALHLDSEFEALRTLKRKHDAYGRRIRALTQTTPSSTTIFAPTELPIDSRTIRAEHFEAIWRVLGLQGDALPHAMHKLALTDLADNRNEIAHGRIDPLDFARRKPLSDALRVFSMTEECVIHLDSTLRVWIDNEQYKRQSA